MSHKDSTSAQSGEVGVVADVRRIVVVGGGPSAHDNRTTGRRPQFAEAE
jgi:hypothetical protein